MDGVVCGWGGVRLFLDVVAFVIAHAACPSLFLYFQLVRCLTGPWFLDVIFYCINGQT